MRMYVPAGCMMLLLLLPFLRLPARNLGLRPCHYWQSTLRSAMKTITTTTYATGDLPVLTPQLRSPTHER
jgi:hypothetical protein